MSASIELKKEIGTKLASFDPARLEASAIALFAALGYHSERRFPGKTGQPQEFIAEWKTRGRFNAQSAMAEAWQEAYFLFQLTGDELYESPQLRIEFEKVKKVDQTYIDAYMIVALRLKGDDYSRSKLATITREINKLFAGPAMVLFAYGGCLTLAVIDRRQNKRDESKDVLQKVTLIKDICTAQPHRAHVEILADLALPSLRESPGFTNWVELHNAWQTVLDSSELNKRFFREVADWYFWAQTRVKFPKGAGKNDEERNSTSLIRLITRLIFVWFLKEKGLVPDDLFDQAKVDALLKYDDPRGSTYYKAILQNLFFATLNQEMNTADKTSRKFRTEAKQTGLLSASYMVHNLYRYRRYFKDPEAALKLFADIPFLNGGLFECLDNDQATAAADKPDVVRVDGFSDRPDNELKVPDELFFGAERLVDLSQAYGDNRRGQEKVRGVLEILHHYKFTVDENTPIEEEVALDPELLGRVFENLLAAYNPETGVTARKQTGSFYTPREIVNYMVDEALIAHFNTALGRGEDAEPRLRQLFAYTEEKHRFTAPEVEKLITAIDTAKILDPACGSGAFPLGVLHRLVFLLNKLDRDNESWKELQRQKAIRETEEAYKIGDQEERHRRLADIEEAFDCNAEDYGRKLYLIENCIYGVDIQPIAVQIAKLRCFISLMVDQRLDEGRPNRGVRPLPNLETKFVAANTLIGVEKPTEHTGVAVSFGDHAITELREQLALVRHEHFGARTLKRKRECREKDAALRKRMAQDLAQSGWEAKTAKLMTAWDPYEQNTHADFFDPEWMFGITDGFDVVIGNPPYVRQEQIKEFKPALQAQYECYTGTADLYVYFFERGVKALGEGGILTYICSNKYFRAGYGEKLRRFLGETTTVRELIDFGDAPVFTSIAYPSILLTQKAPPQANTVRALTWEMGAPLDAFAEVVREKSFALAQSELKPTGWRVEGTVTLSLLDKLKQAGKPLREFTGSRVSRGLTTGLNEAFVVDRATRDRLINEHRSSAEILKPYIRGKDVKRWQMEFADQYIVKIESSENRDHPWSRKPEKEAEKLFATAYPAIYSHFENLRGELINRDDQGRYFWEQRSCRYWREFEQPKIVSTKISNRPTFALDSDGHYLGNTSYFFPAAKAGYFLLGMLNSSLFFTYAKKVFVEKQGGWYEVQPDALEAFPIPAATSGQQKPVETLVKQILSAKRRDAEADVSAWEREIDALVYQLYGLTEEEIKVVEGKK